MTADKDKSEKNQSIRRTVKRSPAGGGELTVLDATRKAFVERLAAAIGSESGRSFAKRAGISQTALTQYTSGKSEPTRPVLIAIASAAGVSLEWLALGEGPMRHDPAAAGAADPAAKAAEPPAPAFIPELLESVVAAIEYGAQMTKRTLTPEQRATLTVKLYSVIERRTRMRMEGDDPAGMQQWMAGKEIAKDLADAMRSLDGGNVASRPRHKSR